MLGMKAMGYALLAVMALTLVGSKLYKAPPRIKFVGLPSADVPTTIDGYRSMGDAPIGPDVRAALPSASIVARSYISDNSAIDFMMVGGTDREALHDPRSCLSGAGWLLENDHTETLPADGVQMHSCHAVGVPGAPGYDILYLYVVDGKLIDTVTSIRIQMLVSALLGRRNTPVYLLRFMQPLNGDNRPVAGEHERMQTFAAQMWDQLRPDITRR